MTLPVLPIIKQESKGTKTQPTNPSKKNTISRLSKKLPLCDSIRWKNVGRQGVCLLFFPFRFCVCVYFLVIRFCQQKMASDLLAVFPGHRPTKAR